jgi:hypothetical protein
MLFFLDVTALTITNFELSNPNNCRVPCLPFWSLYCTNDIRFTTVTYECKTTQGHMHVHICDVAPGGFWVDAFVITAKKFFLQPNQFSVRSRKLAFRSAVP